jgi:large subunit ribosomal protein L6e
MAITSRNTDVSPHIGKLSRSALYSKKGLYKRAYPSAAAPSTDAPLTKSVPIKGAKNGSTRTIPTTKAPAFYPSEDVKRMKISRKTLRPTKLRASITPGTVLIMLAGRFRGKRVVCLGQLEGSGLLLISGPYKINGVPLRRVNQAYVIATSTKIDISALTVSFAPSFL